METNGGSMLLSRLVFRRTRDQKCMATHYSEELQRTKAGKMSKQSPEKRESPNGSLSHDLWNTYDMDIVFHGGNTRTLASRS